ncbi:MAG TPA: hypothetical protein VMX17_05545 [Candidatus Glassbacteria bacterium]|nr:hypothetical protein [Candidatus Glassbacteria bacterium]
MDKNTQHGEDKWDAEEQVNNQKTEFLKLKDGSNNVRFFTNPFKFMTHKVRFTNDPRGAKGGWNVRCGGKGCPLCAKFAGKTDLPDWLGDDLEVEKAKPRWYAGVIDRDAEPNDAKTLELSVLVRGGLKDFAKDKKWGNPRFYDVDVKKNSKAKEPAGWYSVIPDPTDKGVITPEDEEIMNGFNVEALEARCEPFSDEKIEEAIDRYRSWLNKDNDDAPKRKTNKKSNGKQRAAAASNDDADDSEDDEENADPNFTFQETTESA